MLFVLEQLLIGGKNRKIVTAAIIKRVRKVIGSYLPSPYHPKGFINSVEQWFNDSDSIPPRMEGSWIKEIIPEPQHGSNELKKVAGLNINPDHAVKLVLRTHR